MAEDAFGGLAHARYIIDVYVEADDLLRRFDASDRSEHLVEAAEVLCRGLSDLEDDREFWEGLDRFQALPRSQQEGTFDVLQDLDSLIGLEARVLQSSGVPEDVARDLANRAGVAVRGVKRWPDELAFRRFGEAVARARQAACLRAAPQMDPRDSRPYPTVRRVFRITGGVVVIVADASAVVGIPGTSAPQGAASIISGLRIVRNAFRREEN